MISSRILCPQSKLAVSRDIENTTLGESLGIEGIDEDDLYADEDQQAKQTRDPVAQAQRSAEAIEKMQSKRLTDGSIAHSFQSLLRNLSTIVRNTCLSRDAEAGTPTFTVDTQLTHKQREAFQLLKEIKT